MDEGDAEEWCQELMGILRPMCPRGRGGRGRSALAWWERLGSGSEGNHGGLPLPDGLVIEGQTSGSERS